MFIKITSLNNNVKIFEGWENNILDYIKKEFENSSILCVNMRVRDNDLYIEFGEKCCFISMTNADLMTKKIVLNILIYM